MELAIRLMSPPVAHQLLQILGSNSIPKVLEGIGAYWAVCIAGAQGWQVTDIGEGSVVLAQKGAQMAQIVPVVIDTLSRRSPQQEQMTRLQRQLEGVIDNRRFVLHVKQELPAHFDPLVLVHPVQNWVNEIEKGQWSGGYAIYEDNDVALELCLLDEQPVSNGAGLLFHVPPMETEQVLRQAIPQMVQAIERSRCSELPTNVLLLGNEPWRCNPAMMLNVLYGRCLAKVVHTSGDATINFALSGLSLWRMICVRKSAQGPRTP